MEEKDERRHLISLFKKNKSLTVGLISVTCMYGLDLRATKKVVEKNLDKQ